VDGIIVKLRFPFSVITLTLIMLIITACFTSSSISSGGGVDVIELILNRKANDDDVIKVSKLGGKVIYRFDEVNALVIGIRGGLVNSLINSLGGVRWYSKAGVIRPLDVEELPNNCTADGYVLTWNLDMINVPTAHDSGFNGSGVYIAVLDTGLEPQWRDYFDEESIVAEYAAAFLGAQAAAYGITNEVLNKNAWEADSDGHGTAVTAVILGFKVYGIYRVDGTAPAAKVIPVKVIGNQGWGFTSDLAAGILYIAKLYEYEVNTGGNVLDPPGIINPIIISLSVGGPHSELLREVINYAINKGVFIVAAAGNEGDAGMLYPAAYPEVISVGAVGWVRQFNAPGWWRNLDVPEELTSQIYVPNFSSRELSGQELDVLAPGAYVVLPYTPYGTAHPPLQSKSSIGQYYYLSGTSFAAPHISGAIALILQADLVDGKVDVNQSSVESLLKESALGLGHGCAEVLTPLGTEIHCWREDAVGYGLIQINYILTKLATIQ